MRRAVAALFVSLFLVLGVAQTPAVAQDTVAEQVDEDSDSGKLGLIGLLGLLGLAGLMRPNRGGVYRDAPRRDYDTGVR